MTSSSRYPIWNIIDKRLAPGDFTNGFDQTAVGNARSANKRSMSYSATSPTRAARTAREIKAIVRDLTLGLYDRSVYQQQGQHFGDLTAKDVGDITTAILRKWSDLFYNGDIDADPLQFDGILDILGAGTTVTATQSVVKAIQEKVVAMMNSSSRDVLPTHVLANARIRQIISQEYLLVGDKMPTVQGTKGREPGGDQHRPYGYLPIIVDPFNAVVAGTPNTYPTLIISADKVSWQYVEPLGHAGPEPKVFEIVQTNALDTEYKGVMFGALELLPAARPSCASEYSGAQRRDHSGPDFVIPINFRILQGKEQAGRSL